MDKALPLVQRATNHATWKAEFGHFLEFDRDLHDRTAHPDSAIPFG